MVIGEVVSQPKGIDILLISEYGNMINMMTQVYDVGVIPKVNRENNKSKIKMNQVANVLYLHLNYSYHYMQEETCQSPLFFVFPRKPHGEP